MIDYMYIAGGLTRDPEVRHTADGLAVTNFTLAQSDSRKDENGDWETTKNRYLPVSIWDTDKVKWTKILPALDKGTRLVAHGKLVTHQWEHEGEKYSRLVFAARDIYIHASARAGRTTNTSGNSTAAAAWNEAEKQGRTAMTGGFGNQDDDNPPF